MKGLITEILREECRYKVINEGASEHVKSVVKDLKVSSNFIFHFGTGIGAFMGPIKRLLENGSISITDEEVALLVITSVYLLYSSSKEDIEKLVTELKERGIYEHLKKVVNIIKTVNKAVVELLFSFVEWGGRQLIKQLKISVHSRQRSLFKT